MFTHYHWVTTDEVLIEVLDAFANAGRSLRRRSAQIVRRILSSPDVTVIPESRESFLEGLTLYERRLDKAYSATDCISMCVMRRRGIREALTADHHFHQEGFTVLMTA